MQAEQEFGVREVFSHVIGDMAKAISERSGEGKLEQFIRARVAAAMIVDLEPRDVMQVMLAGHCVMFHEVMTDSVHETLRGELPGPVRRATLTRFDQVFGLGLEAWRPKTEAVPEDIDALARERLAARKAKNWAEADRLRALLRDAGWDMEDRPDGYTLKRR